MRKPEFGLVIGLLSIFFVLCLLRTTFERFIPQLPPNKLANRPGNFLRIASHQPVDWQPEFTDALQRAKRLRRPCLVVMGRSSSEVGRLMDQRVFANWSVATFINSSFVAVRIDLGDRPSWASAVFPISRMAVPFIEGFQIAVLDSSGDFQRFISPPQDLAQIDSTQFLDELVSVKSDLANLSASPGPGTDASRQKDDLSDLSAAAATGIPHFSEFASNAVESSSDKFGAFTEFGFLRILPLTWLFLSRVGEDHEATQSLTQVLLSPAYDLIRGGVYNIGESSEDLDVDFSQETVPNAELAAALAEIGLIAHQHMFEVFGEQTFDMVVRDLTSNRLFVECRPSDGDSSSDRSPTTSFTSSRLNDELNPTELSWATEHLHLNRFENRQLIPFLDGRGTLKDPMFEQVMRKLRAGLPSGPIKAEAYSDVSGETLASLCRCARLWGDARRFSALLPSIFALDRFANGPDIVHRQTPDPQNRYLGDYLAYADAQLQIFLVTGEEDRFDHGLAVLQQALARFYDQLDCEMLSLSPSESERMPTGFNCPDLADDLHESNTSRTIRLCMDYGRLVGSATLGQKLKQLAATLVGKEASLPISMSPSMGSYYLAAANVRDPECAIVVGPNAKRDADNLFRKRPSRLVAAASSRVRPELLARPPGVYLVSGADVAGPFSVEQAAQNMPVFLQVGIPAEPNLGTLP